MSREWILRAACRGEDPEKWFPLGQAGRFSMQDPPPDVELPAKRICSSCPVQAQCLRYGMENESPSYRWGIFGGLNPSERKKLFKETNR